MQPRLVLHLVYTLELPWCPNLHFSSAEMTGLSKHIWAYYHYQLLCPGVHCLSPFRYATQSLSLSPTLDLILFLPNIHLCLSVFLFISFFNFVCVTGSCYVVLCGLEVPLQPRLASILANICVFGYQSYRCVLPFLALRTFVTQKTAWSLILLTLQNYLGEISSQQFF